MNLLGALVCPKYEAMFIVESRDLDELRTFVDAAAENDESVREQFVVTSTVGRLDAASDKELRRAGHLYSFTEFVFVPIALGYGWIIPLIIVKVLTKDSPNHGISTKSQQVWTLAWPLLANILGAVFAYITERKFWRTYRNRFPVVAVVAVGVPLVAASVPAIGGFVVVGQMLENFGICTRLPIT